MKVSFAKLLTNGFIEQRLLRLLRVFPIAATNVTAGFTVFLLKFAGR